MVLYDVKLYPCDYLLKEITTAAKEKPTRKYIDIDENLLYEKLVDGQITIPNNNFKFNLDSGNVICRTKNYYQCLDIVQNIIGKEFLKLEHYVLNPVILELPIITRPNFNFEKLIPYTNIIPFCGDKNYRKTTVLIRSGFIHRAGFSHYMIFHNVKMLYDIFVDTTSKIKLLITSRNQVDFNIELYPIYVVKDYYLENRGRVIEKILSTLPDWITPAIYSNEVDDLVKAFIFINESYKNDPSFDSYWYSKNSGYGINLDDYAFNEGGNYCAI